MALGIRLVFVLLLAGLALHAPAQPASMMAPTPGSLDTAQQYLLQMQQPGAATDVRNIPKALYMLQKGQLPLDTQLKYVAVVRRLAAGTRDHEDNVRADLLQAKFWIRRLALDSTVQLTTALLKRPLTPDQRAEALLRRSQGYFPQGKYKEALTDVLEAQELVKASRDTLLIASLYMQFALTYGQEGHRAEVIQAYKTAERVLRNSKAYQLRAIILNNLANVYYETPDSALYFLRQAYSISKRGLGQNGVGIAATSLTEVFVLIRKLDSARFYAQEALSYLEKSNNNEVWLSLNQSLALLALQEGHYQASIDRLNLVIEKAQSLKMRRIVRDCYLQLADAYAGLRDWTRAYHYYHLQHKVTDSLNGPERTAELARLAEEHNAKIRQARIDQLQDESATQEAALQHQAEWLIIALALMLSFGTLLVGGIITYRRLQLEEARLRHLRQMQEEQQAQLQAAGRTKDQLLQIIANELREPITRWQELPDALEQYIAADDYEGLKAPLARFRQHTEEVGVILESLLSWAQAQRKSLIYSPQSISLHQICQSLQPLANLYNAVPVRLCADCPAHMRIWADLATLETTLRNLVAQAIQHLPPGGQLQMSARATDGTIELFFYLATSASAPSSPLTSLLSQALITDLVQHNSGALHHDHGHLQPGYLFSLELPRATDARMPLAMAG